MYVDEQGVDSCGILDLVIGVFLYVLFSLYMILFFQIMLSIYNVFYFFRGIFRQIGQNFGFDIQLRNLDYDFLNYLSFIFYIKWLKYVYFLKWLQRDGKIVLFF